MSPREAAQMTGMNRLTLLKWIKSGRLPATPVQTAHGPGYDIRMEDLTQALQRPRRQKEPSPKPVRGSVVEELQAMRELISAQGDDAARREDALRAELHDLRAQLYQTERRLEDAIRALPAPSLSVETPPSSVTSVETPRKGFAQWFGRKK